MAVAPDVHVGGKLDTIVGTTNVGVAEKGSVVVALRGYGSYAPEVDGEAVFARVSSLPIDVLADGLWTVWLYRNNLIEPGGTYYTFTFMDSNGDVVQTVAKQFNTAGDYQFGQLPPFDPSQPPVPLPPQLTNNWLWVPWNAPQFDGAKVTSFGMQLAGNVTATFVNGYPGTLYTFFLVQDAAGGHTFTWPSNLHNYSSVPKGPNQALVQTFVADSAGTNLYAIGPATYYQL